MTKLFTIIALAIAGLIVLVTLTNGSGSGATAASPAATETSRAPARPTPAPRPIVVDATTLVGQYDANKLAAQQRYTGKVVQTTARVTNITSTLGQPSITLEPDQQAEDSLTSLSCDFDSATPLLTLHNGQHVTVRGTMQDEFMTIISMEHCTLVRG